MHLHQFHGAKEHFPQAGDYVRDRYRFIIISEDVINFRELLFSHLKLFDVFKCIIHVPDFC